MMSGLSVLGLRSGCTRMRWRVIEGVVWRPRCGSASVALRRLAQPPDALSASEPPHLLPLPPPLRIRALAISSDRILDSLISPPTALLLPPCSMRSGRSSRGTSPGLAPFGSALWTSPTATCPSGSNTPRWRVRRCLPLPACFCSVKPLEWLHRRAQCPPADVLRFAVACSQQQEMRHKQVNHARNVWDRAVSILPRIDQVRPRLSPALSAPSPLSDRFCPGQQPGAPPAPDDAAIPHLGSSGISTSIWRRWWATSPARGRSLSDGCSGSLTTRRALRKRYPAALSLFFLWPSPVLCRVTSRRGSLLLRLIVVR